MTDTVVIVPIRHRAHRVAPVAESVWATSDARLLFACTVGDTAVLNAVDAAGADRIEIEWQPGDYARKINAGYRASTEALIFLGADDLLFHPGWLDAARAKLGSGVGVVGTNDLGSQRVMRGEHATHSLVTRAYADDHGLIDRPGAILFEGYEHEWCDDELVATAKRRGAWAFAADSRVEHLHPNWGKGPTDAFYAGQGPRIARGRAVFNRRKSLWT